MGEKGTEEKPHLGNSLMCSNDLKKLWFGEESDLQLEAETGLSHAQVLVQAQSEGASRQQFTINNAKLRRLSSSLVQSCVYMYRELCMARGFPKFQ